MNVNRDPMLDMYIFESAQLLEQLEQIILSSEKSGFYSSDEVNEVFRIMHTIKGSSAMMMFDNISMLAHTMEDLFFYLREDRPQIDDYSKVSDLVLVGTDFIKGELDKIEKGIQPNGSVEDLTASIKDYLSELKGTVSSDGSSSTSLNRGSAPDQKYYISLNNLTKDAEYNSYKALVFFEDGCEMENIRAYTIIHSLKEMARDIFFTPSDIIENEESIETIRAHGFEVIFTSSKSKNELEDFFQQTIFLKHLEFEKLENDDEVLNAKNRKEEERKVIKPVFQKSAEKDQFKEESEIQSKSTHQKIISVNVSKLDKLMDLVGELAISEVMVTQNPDLNGLKLDNFLKSARQLKKITGEIQDIVMSIRMVPLSTTFQKMNRIIRDMCKKLGKDVELEIIGEETEVDKNIIEHISDPLMHLIRNSLDHGIESAEDRLKIPKPEKGKIVLEAKNAGGDVLITVKDDGRGLSREKILDKARENGLITRKESELTDKEIYSFIFLPGFSTKSNITEFSGRGVGMDVVTKNIDTVGGSVSVDSIENAGTTVTLKIPLTLAIVDGMNIKVGNSHYTIPTTSIKESFRPKEKDIIIDPDGNEMIMVRGFCYPIVRLHKLYDVKTDITDFTDGILIMVEQDSKIMAIFADALIGQQQVVVKALPNYIRNSRNIKGLEGCTLLGDGSISLILDVGGIMGKGRTYGRE